MESIAVKIVVAPRNEGPDIMAGLYDSRIDGIFDSRRLVVATASDYCSAPAGPGAPPKYERSTLKSGSPITPSPL